MCSQNFGLIPTLRVLGETLAIWRGVGGVSSFSTRLCKVKVVLSSALHSLVGYHDMD